MSVKIRMMGTVDELDIITAGMKPGNFLHLGKDTEAGMILTVCKVVSVSGYYANRNSQEKRVYIEVE